MSSGMRIELLGTMRVLVGGGPMPKVRSRKAKWLLALLALRGGKPIARSVVAETFWPDTDADLALTNLRSVVRDLRQALGTEGERLRTPDRRTLAFDFQDVAVDVLAFDAAIQEGDWQTAVDLYAGPLLQDCGEDWVGPERSRREQSCLSAFHDLSERVDPSRAVILSQRAVELAPWQDGPRRDLMAAHVRAGDLNAALAAYRDFAHALRAETGGTPDPQTTEYYARLRSGLDSQASGEPAFRGTLPHAFSSFVGREDERVELGQATRIYRLITLTGAGGIGKTRLAREVAFDLRADSPDGASFVALEAVRGEAGLTQAVVSGLRIKISSKLPPAAALIEALRPRQLLLVLDNCEHMVPACAKLADRLLTECPNVRILATSREPLGLVGEKVWPLSGLSTPDVALLPDKGATLLRVLMAFESVRLFVERASTAAKDFELNRENALAIAELCATLEGSPLALELAAGRVRTMGVADILQRFRDHRLDFLAGNRHAGAARHQTLRSALDWSFSLLSGEERRLLARLSVFANGWTIEAAEAIAEATPALLESLVEKSLVVFLPGGRYGLLETVRQYAAERLEASGDASLLRARHVAYYVELAQHLVGTQAHYERYDREMGNFNAVMDRPDTDPAKFLALTRALHWYWHETFAIAEGARRLEDALRKSDPRPSETRAQAIRNLGLLRSHLNRAEAVALHEESLVMWRELDDRPGMLRTLSTLGLEALFVGESHRAIALAEESVAIARGIRTVTNVESMLAYSLVALATVRIDIGEYVRAREHCDESLELMRKHARPMDVGLVLRTLSFIAHHLNDYDTYRRLNEEALEIYRSSANIDGAAWCLMDLGIAATEQGQLALGQDLFEEALSVMHHLGDRLGTASVREWVAINAAARGDLERAQAILRECAAQYRAIGHPKGIARSLDAVGDTLRLQGDSGAVSSYREALSIWIRLGARPRVRDGLTRIGSVVGNSNDAIRLWGFVDRWSTELEGPIPMPLSGLYEASKRRAETAMGFETERVLGAEMTLEDACKLALRP